MRKRTERDKTLTTPPLGQLAGGGAGPESYPRRSHSLGNPGQTQVEARLVPGRGGDAAVGQGWSSDTRRGLQRWC